MPIRRITFLDQFVDNILSMSSRLDPSWSVISSVQTFGGDRCVDVFVRPNGSFGYEEFRRDPEDMGVWTPLHYFSQQEFSNENEVIDAARRSVPWFALLSDG
jgi:hypothetical protein